MTQKHYANVKDTMYDTKPSLDTTVLGNELQVSNSFLALLAYMNLLFNDLSSVFLEFNGL